MTVVDLADVLAHPGLAHDDDIVKVETGLFGTRISIVINLILVDFAIDVGKIFECVASGYFEKIAVNSATFQSQIDASVSHQGINVAARI